MSRIIASLRTHWAAEAPRHFLWLPVCFGAGIGVYFFLPGEPSGLAVVALALLAVLGTALGFRRAPLLVIAVGLAVGGFCWTFGVTHRHAPVMLHEAVSPRPVTGIVDDVERTEKGVRLTLTRVGIEDYDPVKTPGRVRLSVRLKKGATVDVPAIGDRLAMRAGLMPPMGPALPHGFDFGRYFYFRDIGAVGYGLPPWQTAPPDETTGFGTRFRNWRLGITEHIIGRLGTGVGGVAAGLITGDARAISQADYNALRASNLYHIIAISGEHMVVIAGVIFVTLRLWVLALPARLRFRPEMKSAAAALTLALVTAYLFVTGLPISAVRAYVMIALVLIAVICRRQVDAMRSLAITAFVMLLFQPANLLDPGFQLSFAATLAIIALVEAMLRSPLADRGPVVRAVTAIGTVLLISVVAEAATAPFVIAQFNNISPYGVPANMIATWLVSFYLMPTVALFFMLLPFGLQNIALWLMGWGIKALLGLAYWIAHFPHAQLFSPSIPGYGVALFALGLLWLCLWQTRWRRWGLLPMILGVSTLLLVRHPDLLIGPGMKQVALRDGDGYALARGRAGSMIPEMWANGLGYGELPEADTPAWRCDKLGCVARVERTSVALPVDGMALATDCARAQVIATALAPVHCAQGQARILSSTALGQGVTALWIRHGLRAETSSDWQGVRPWSIAGDDAEDGD